MPGRGSSTFRQSALWIAASLVALIAGLIMLMHEQHAHDMCSASIHGIGRLSASSPPDCGFADTVYWAGMVVFLSAAVSLIGAMWSGVATLSSAAHLKARINWSSQHDSLAPADRVTFGQLEPPAWLSLTSPAPFEAPKRRQTNGASSQTAHSQTVPSQTLPSTPRASQSPSPSRSATVMADATTVPSAPGQALQSAPRTPAATAVLPAPAWYPDPQDPQAIRWWDGTRWGESRPRTA